MKYLLIVLSILLGSMSIVAQEKSTTTTKMTEFASRSGVILKFEDFNLPKVKTAYGQATTKVRKISSGGEEKCFFQVSKMGKYDEKTASIAYEDLLEIQKAIKALKHQADIDLNTASDYLENKFKTVDGFQVGYYVDDNKMNWYMVLERTGSDNTVFVNSVDQIEIMLTQGRTKMDELNN